MDFQKIEKGSVILCSGDSVTDCGRARPYGSYRDSLGESYVKRLHEIVTAEYPEKEIKFVNAGISGETSRHIRNRWISDCEAVKPDYATLLIGVNDVWRQYDRWMDKDMAVGIEEYEENLRFVAEWSAKHLKGFTLIAPFFLELDREEFFMKQVLARAAVCEKIARETGAQFISLQDELDRLCRSRYTLSFSPDRVHPFPVTHTAIALYLLRQWNFKFRFEER